MRLPTAGLCTNLNTTLTSSTCGCIFAPIAHVVRPADPSTIWGLLTLAYKLSGDIGSSSALLRFALALSFAILWRRRTFWRSRLVAVLIISFVGIKSKWLMETDSGPYQSIHE